MKVIRGESIEPRRATLDIFTGEVHSHAIVDETSAEQLRLTLVRFSAGGRTKWHHHSFDQALLITEGRGIVASEPGEHLVGPGDVVLIPAGEKHWHGGTESSAMSHISITTPGETTVLEAVEAVRTRD